MLAFDELDTLTEPILELYEVYIQSVLNEIARRLRGMKLTSSTAWMMQRLTESGLIYEHALKELEKLTGISEKELRRAFREAGVLGIRFDDRVYKAAGLKPLPLNMSPAMTQVLAAGLRKTGGVMRNLTMTTAMSAQNLFIEAADLAYMQVASGAFDYISALRDAVEHVARKGLTVIRFPGRSEQLDVAMRRVVLTGIGQTTGELQLTRAKEMGMNLMQVSAHIGARNEGTGPMNHESWQGKVYSIVGSTPEYPNLAEVTGLGTVVGLHGVSCRHSMYPFYEGLSEKLYTQKELDDYANQKVIYQGKEMSVYEATQQQRAIERKIREWKRKAGALEAAGLDHEMETVKVREWQARMRAFVKETGLIRQGEREQNIISGESIIASTMATFRETLSGEQTTNGTIINEISKHFCARSYQRDIDVESVREALTRPINDLVTILDSQGKSSVRYIGKKATVIVEPSKGVLITTWRTSRSKIKNKGMLSNE